jgi:rhamnose utilization protein RhaD (predicted bifunctional aldolase and dehydrogenase)/NAD(P)-dependent dehydrogenase (short-subunit alcohol dehydrogenase family)
MENLWCESQAAQCQNDVDLCVYASRLLGANPQLVLHGGGNTSVKTQQQTLFGDYVDAICVKGSGWDLATIEVAGLPALKLQPLLRLRELDQLSDEAMVNYQRTQLFDAKSPNPSIETLLHAFLPQRFVFHTHANAILSITNQVNGDELCRQIFGDDFALVPYVKPGFDLAKLAADVYDAHPQCKGLILLNHGIFTFSDDAYEAYTAMIDAITKVEEYIRHHHLHNHVVRTVKTDYTAEEVMPLLRRACSREFQPQRYQRLLVAFHYDKLIERYVNGAALKKYSQQGVVTPDHIIRTKNLPLILPCKLSDVEGAINEYVEEYHQYFKRNNELQSNPKVELDPFPRVILAPGLGLFVTGKSAKEIKVNADIAKATMATILDADSIGRFKALPEADLFEMEYWSLEQAKLAAQKELSLSRQVVLVTGAAGTIGAACAKAFTEQGAQVVLLDCNIEKCREVAASTSPHALAIECDVTDQQQVASAFKQITQRFGGVDIVIFNAGCAYAGKIGEIDDALFRKSFELNFFAHQTIAQHAVRIMQQQKTGGKLLFNVSKQSLNPGLDFGAYGIPKAAMMALVRQYALDYAAEGIQANAVNADRIRSGLLNDKMIEQRAKARGVSVDDYMRGNLLKREVTADDVAKAFVHQALSHKTTAGITTVDGGNIAAAVR